MCVASWLHNDLRTVDRWGKSDHILKLMHSAAWYLLKTNNLFTTQMLSGRYPKPAPNCFLLPSGNKALNYSYLEFCPSSFTRAKLQVMLVGCRYHQWKLCATTNYKGELIYPMPLNTTLINLVHSVDFFRLDSTFCF